jgi:hypothetical protein
MSPNREGTIGWTCQGGDYVYDTAMRMSANPRRVPREGLLHAATRIGVPNLRLDARTVALRMASFPCALRRLKPHEVEDVLCIFNDLFGPRRVVCVGAGVDDARTTCEILPAPSRNACG